METKIVYVPCDKCGVSTPTKMVCDDNGSCQIVKAVCDKCKKKCDKCGKDLAYSSRSSHVKYNRCKYITDLITGIVPPKPDDDKPSDLDFPNPSLLSTDF